MFLSTIGTHWRMQYTWSCTTVISEPLGKDVNFAFNLMDIHVY